MRDGWSEPGPDATPASGSARRCTRCGVTRKGPLWYVRHRLFTCHPERLEIRARIHARAQAIYATEEPF